MDFSKNIISQENFDRFLSALDPDRELAVVRYEKLWAKLIKFFMLRGFEEPEDLADQTIGRVIRKIQDVEKPYDIERYLYGVAQRISSEYLRRRRLHTDLPDLLEASSTTPQEIKAETTYTCLEQCMAKLSPDLRDLILQYYESEGSTKIQSRKAMAQELGISVNALRIRSHQIRAELERCITKCLKKQQEER